MNHQALNIEQMQHLKELGLDTSNASMCWLKFGEEPPVLSVHDEYCYESSALHATPAFTLQDILELLPNNVDNELFLFIDKGKNKWRIGYTDKESEEIFEDFIDKNFIDAAYNILCWCIENGYVETKKEE